MYMILPRNDSPRQQPIQIPLTQGQIALVDPIDADLALFNWFAKKSVDRPSGYYAARNSQRPHRRTVFIHRIVLERMLGRALSAGELVDHIDGNTLNNRRTNLRVATPAQNVWNSKRPCNNTSGFKGVSLNKSQRKWRANIDVNGQRLFLGYFDTPEAAHHAYMEAAKHYRGTFARGE